MSTSGCARTDDAIGGAACAWFATGMAKLDMAATLMSLCNAAKLHPGLRLGK
jgi:hypothetical protein